MRRPGPPPEVEDISFCKETWNSWLPWLLVNVLTLSGSTLGLPFADAACKGVQLPDWRQLPMVFLRLTAVVEVTQGRSAWHGPRRDISHPGKPFVALGRRDRGAGNDPVSLLLRHGFDIPAPFSARASCPSAAWIL